MNSREIEQLEKKSIYSLRVNNELKESVVQSYLTDLNKVVKREIKRKDIVILVLEE